MSTLRGRAGPQWAYTSPSTEGRMGRSCAMMSRALNKAGNHEPPDAGGQCLLGLL